MMADPWLNEWMQEFSDKFHAMEEYQGQTEFLNEEELKMFNLAKEFFMITLGNLFNSKKD